MEIVMNLIRKIKNIFNFERDYIGKIGYPDERVINALDKSYELEKKYFKGV